MEYVWQPRLAWALYIFPSLTQNKHHLLAGPLLKCNRYRNTGNISLASQMELNIIVYKHIKISVNRVSMCWSIKPTITFYSTHAIKIARLDVIRCIPLGVNKAPVNRQYSLNRQFSLLVTSKHRLKKSVTHSNRPPPLPLLPLSSPSLPLSFPSH